MTFRLLLADDDEVLQWVMEESLSQLGYSVDLARDGQDAWEKIEAQPDAYDLVLLDKHMPRLDGISLLRRIRSEDSLGMLPVIMLTGDSRPEDIAEGLAAGAYYYLTKPSEQKVLSLIIGNALEEARKKRELQTLVAQHQNSLSLLKRAEFHFKQLREARELALILASASDNRERTIIGFTELLVNAVEHGNLGISYAEKGQFLAEGRWIEEVEKRLQSVPYSERVVNVTMERSAELLIVTIVDQGNGFDWLEFMEIKPERAFDLHGRGIALSKAISFDQMEYIGNGNTVVVEVKVS